MTTVSVPIVLPDFTTFSIGALTYQGTWNASTNTPTLASGVGTKGQYYVVSVAGTTSLDGHAVWSPADVAIFNGTAWDILQGGISSGEVITALGYTPANKAGDTITGPLAVSGASFGLSGNISAAAWTTNGVRYKNVGATLTDTSSSGTVAAAYTDVWGGNTIAASSATTFTNYYGGYYKTPVAGSNATLSSAWALGADSLKVNGAASVNPGGNNPILFFQNPSFTAFNGISLNGVITDAGVQGFFGGSNGDTTLYFQSQGGMNFRTGGNTTNASLSSIGQFSGNLGSAIPAGGANTVGFKATSTTNFGVFFGSGAPTLSAAKGSLYLRSDGSSSSTRLYVNSDGSTTWVAVTTAS